MVSLQGLPHSGCGDSHPRSCGHVAFQAPTGLPLPFPNREEVVGKLICQASRTLSGSGFSEGGKGLPGGYLLIQVVLLFLPCVSFLSSSSGLSFLCHREDPREWLARGLPH